MRYTVKQLATLAGVSVRTLHHYDHIDLLKPSDTGANGYRYYDAEALYRLQQILFYRELRFGLDEIRDLLGDPDFDLERTLHDHRQALHDEIARLQRLIDTVDQTIQQLHGEIPMSDKKMFASFSKEQEAEYAEQAAQRWDRDEVQQSYKRWNRYSAEQQQAIKDEGVAIYTELAALVGRAPDSDDVQAVIARWHQHLRYFYEPTVERLRGLGQLYVDSPDFAERFRDLHTDLPAFMQAAINHYCDQLES